MLTCIPTKGNAGLEDTVFDHFGSAPYFTLYDSKTGEIKIVKNRNAHHSHGTCHPMNQLSRYHIDSVVCLGMGRRAIEALDFEGIRVYDAGSNKVSEVVDKIKAEELTEIDPARACRGHGQRPAPMKQPYGNRRGRGAGYGQGGCRYQGRGFAGWRGER